MYNTGLEILIWIILEYHWTALQLKNPSVLIINWEGKKKTKTQEKMAYNII